MKKELKAIAIATIVTCLLIVGCSYAMPAYAETEFYPLTAVVTAYDRAADTVSCTDFNGNVWVFYGVEDWSIGDVCSMLMWTCETEQITDDEIIDVVYSGYLSTHSMVEWLSH